MTVPGLWVDTDISRFNAWYETVHINKVSLDVANKRSNSTVDLVLVETNAIVAIT